MHRAVSAEPIKADYLNILRPPTPPALQVTDPLTPKFPILNPENPTPPPSPSRLYRRNASLTCAGSNCPRCGFGGGTNTRWDWDCVPGSCLIVVSLSAAAEFDSLCCSSNSARAAWSCASAHCACTVRAFSMISPANTFVNPLIVVTTLAGTDCESAWLTIRRSVSFRNFARLNRSYRSDCWGLNASTSKLSSN